MSHRQRHREKLRQRFPLFLFRWLAKLPSGRWEETSRELWAALDTARKPFEMFPAPNVLLAALDEHAGTVATAGLWARTRRTARARLVVGEQLPADVG